LIAKLCIINGTEPLSFYLQELLGALAGIWLKLMVPSARRSIFAEGLRKITLSSTTACSVNEAQILASTAKPSKATTLLRPAQIMKTLLAQGQI